MSEQRIRPANRADERTQLVGWLDMQRGVARWKCEGLSEEDVRKPVLPTSPLMTLAGVVNHLRWCEHLWFEVEFLNQPDRGPWAKVGNGEINTELAMHVDDMPITQILADYDKQCAISNEIVAAHSLDDVAAHPDGGDDPFSLRWILFHMIEETARHAGQMDTIRELIDGRVGYF